MVVAFVAMAGSAYALPSSTPTVTPPSSTATSTVFRAQLAEKQAQVDALNAKLDALDNQAEIATEEYNQASAELASATAAANAAQADLNNSRAALAVQESILGSRVASIYRDGKLSAFEVLLGSKSIGDFVGRVKFIDTVSLNDANIAGGLKAQKTLMETQFAELQKAQAQAQTLQFELKAREVEVNLRIGESQKMLDSAQADVRKLLDKQAAKRESQSKILLQQVLSGANKSGIVATPGSPVETALSYCGVPYIWGGASPSGFDCSGLMMYVFAQHGVFLPHYSGFQFLQGIKIPMSEIQPNDVVFFGSPVHHVGLYCGGGYFIEAPHHNDVVKISKLAGRSDIAGVRRYPWVPRTANILAPQTNTDSALRTVR